ncbi:MAG: class I SAM-dependent methyltransferase [Planctomycetes bacterium]|nr:class I SAM-dependent methyltransferase [Planctomycetota bacterium]
MSVDFGRAADDYARHRAGFPPALPARLEAMGVLRPALVALDVGAGTGALTRWLARAGCRAIALDPSRAMLAQGRALDEGLAIARVVGVAERLPVARASLDLVTAGQCWHWLDRPRAAAEARRALRPGGALVIAHFDWVPLPGNVVEATERLIDAHNPAWRGGGTTGLYPAWLADAALAGFEGLETFSVDAPVAYTHEAWRGRIRASAGVGASLPSDAVARFDADLAALLAADFPRDPLVVPHRLWALVARAPR